MSQESGLCQLLYYDHKRVSLSLSLSLFFLICLCAIPCSFSQPASLLLPHFFPFLCVAQFLSSSDPDSKRNKMSARNGERRQRRCVHNATRMPPPPPPAGFKLLLLLLLQSPWGLRAFLGRNFLFAHHRRERERESEAAASSKASRLRLLLVLSF